MSTPMIEDIKEEIKNAIAMYEKVQQHQVHQWLTTTDLMCILYLLQSIANELDKEKPTSTTS